MEKKTCMRAFKLHLADWLVIGCLFDRLIKQKITIMELTLTMHTDSLCTWRFNVFSRLNTWSRINAGFST